MTRVITIMLILAAAMLGGCAQVTVTSPHREAAAAPAAADSRDVAQLRAENRQLRVQMAKLENDNRAWQVAIDSRQDQLRQLKAQRDQVKQDRDGYKKAAKARE